ncbi:hypothetical protein [Mycobacterium riyadhense]|nr:hypothetical protein [Mycobacterium riyadhense]
MSNLTSGEDRIRAHIQLCWLALLLVRVAETSGRRAGTHAALAASDSAR